LFACSINKLIKSAKVEGEDAAAEEESSVVGFGTQGRGEIFDDMVGLMVEGGDEGNAGKPIPH
jgi:hypothetical protein